MKYTKVAIFLIILFAIGAGVFLFSGNIIEEEFFVDYESLGALAKNHPRGERLLERVHERDAWLSDDDPNNDAEAYQLIAFDMRQLGDEEAAISAYKESLKINPQSTLTWNNIATSYRDLGKFSEAEEAYRKIIELSPGDVAAYRNLADVFLFQYPDDEEGLLEVINTGIDHVLNPSDLLSYLAVYYRDRGDAAKAIEYFEKFLSINPSNTAVEEEIERLRAK